MRAAVFPALAVYWLACSVYVRRLPDRYPIHFNMRGEPDGWASGTFEWFLLPLIATFTVLLILTIGRLARSSPQLWNVPEKKRFLALTPEQQSAFHVSEVRGTER